MTAQASGLAVVQPQAMQIVDRAEEERLARNLILRDASPEQLRLVLAICARYDLDPLLRHALIIKNNLYITRDGLRHVAWQSGQFDGYDPPEERQERDGKWVVTVRVWRKGIGRPFVATAYQREAENQKSDVWRTHPRLMTLKCAEVMALRMAFDVSLPGAEEVGWEETTPRTNIGAARYVEAIEGEVVDGDDQGRPGRAPARLPAATPAGARLAQAGAPAAEQAEAGEVPAELGWTPFWAWAKDRGLKTRDDVDRLLGAATIGMTPAEMKAAILAQAPGGEKRPLTADETLAWFKVRPHTVAEEERGCKHLFSLTEEQDELDALYDKALPLVHQDAIDAAWHDRMVDLGRPFAVFPPAEEEQESDGGALQGDVPGDEHPAEVPF